jgi:hypothetical protein
MNKDLRGLYTWSDAQSKCSDGWRLPTLEELQCLCEIKTHFRGFNGKQYWSSKRKGNEKAVSVTTNDCKDETEKTGDKYSVRCVAE